MSIKFFLKYFLILLLSVINHNITAQNKASTSGKLEFIENRGQWNTEILYKANISHGAVFLEKNCITYNFVNPVDVSFSLAHNHYTGNKGPDTIHFHAYKVHILNSNIAESNSSTPLSTKHNAPSTIYGSYPTKDYCNYFIGNDIKKWTSNVAKYKTVSYDNIYKNIDMNIYSTGKNLEYDFVVHPGGNVEDIALLYEGQNGLQIKDYGLKITNSFNDIEELKPNAYVQNTNDRSAIECNFSLKDNIVRFSVKDYDKSKVLVIDPQLIFSTYSGSDIDNWGFTATYDNDNNVYSGGIAFGVGYPVTTGAYQTKFGGGVATNYTAYGEDVAIIKYDPTGTKRLYATYLGGKGSEMPHSMIVNQFNELLIFGTTGSDNFPVSADAYSKTFKGGTEVTYDFSIDFKNGSDIFVSKLSADGTQLLASTYVGGSENDGLNFRPSDVYYMMEGNDSLFYNYGDDARGEIITDNLNNVYIGSCTFSSDFPVTGNSFQPQSGGLEEGVVFKLDYNLSNLVWSSYIGGSGDDAIYSIDVDKNYNLYVAGGTNSANFPTTSNALHKNYLGGTADAFVAHISEDGTKLLGSTFYGSTEYDQAYFVRTDKHNNPYLAGQTMAHGSDLIYHTKYNRPNSGQFIAKLSPELDSLRWSTVFGTGIGRPNISISAFAVDICEKIYLVGWGREWADIVDTINWGNIKGTKNMDITPDAVQKITDGQDFYVMVLTDSASSLYYASFFGELNSDTCYFGGHDHVDGGTSRFDKRGNIYESACASCGACEGFPTYPNPGAWSNTNNSANCNNAVFKINIFKDFALADFQIPQTGCAPYTVNFVNQSEGVHYKWNFGDCKGASPCVSTLANPSHTYNKSGTYNITLIAIDSSSCNMADTITKQIQILSDTTTNLPDINICSGIKQQIGTPPFNDETITYTWSPQTGLSDPYISNPYAYPDTTTRYMLIVSNKLCTDTIFQKVIYNSVAVNLGKDTAICQGSTIALYAKLIKPESGETYNYRWNTDAKGESITVNKGGVYTVTVTDSNGCMNTDSVKVTINPLPAVNLVKDDTICPGTNIILNPNYNGAATYKWSNGARTANLQVSQAGTYILTITDMNNCTSIDTVFVAMYPGGSLNLGKNDTVNEGDNFPILHAGSGFVKYTWQDGSTGSADSSYKATGIGKYWVTTIDKNGCKLSDTIIIYEICKVKDVFVPNVFIPENGTICNQTFMIEGRCLGNINVDIFNRWGDKVSWATYDFTQEQPDNDNGLCQDQSHSDLIGPGKIYHYMIWDGTDKRNGEQASQGVYFYIIQYRFRDNPNTSLQTKKGSITIIR